MTEDNFVRDLAELLSKYGLEYPSNTPAHILAAYLWNCLLAYDNTVLDRDNKSKHDPSLTDPEA